VLDSFAALREREFRLLFTGQIVSLLGDAITTVALAFAVLDLTGSATDLGYVFAAKTIPLIAFLLVGGVFADRLPRRAVMLAADVLRGAAQGTVALLVLTHSAQIWEIVILQAISGTATAFFNPASTGLTPMTVSPERLQQANALRPLDGVRRNRRLGNLRRACRGGRPRLGACDRRGELRRQRILPRAAAAARPCPSPAAIVLQGSA
jgi:MFS family permease